MTTAKKPDVNDILDWLEEDANQLRVGGHGSLEREANLVALRKTVGNIKELKLTPREGHPWPVTEQAGTLAQDEYAQPTAHPSPADRPIVEGDPARDATAVANQRKAEQASAAGEEPQPAPAKAAKKASS